jgi:S1-C subfamily serine protease
VPRLSLVDVAIVVFALAMAAIGWELGLVRSALPLLGFLGGVIAGSRLGPSLVSGGADSRYAPIITLVVALFAGAVMASVMDVVGTRISARIGARGIAGGIDGLGGATLLAALALLVAWSFGAVLLQAASPGSQEIRKAVAGSAVLGALNGALPPSGPLLHILRRVDPGAAIHGPSAQVAPPTPAVLRDRAVRQARGAVVKIVGTACGLGLEGSGWSAGHGLIVTNAHVVAGEEDTSVTLPTAGTELSATVVHYEPRSDLAILRVTGAELPALRLAPAPAGAPAAVLGYPENGPFRAAAARVGRSGVVSTQDSYGRGPIKRRVLPFRGAVRSGNSGGPLLDAHGRVAGTVFAANESGPAGGLAVPDAEVTRALRGPLKPTSTGPCVA